MASESCCFEQWLSTSSCCNPESVGGARNPSPVNDAACDCEDLARSGIIQSAAIGIVVRWESIHHACLLPQLPNTLMLPLLQPPLCLPPCLHSLTVRWCASVDLA